MTAKVCVVFLFILSSSGACYARQLSNSNITDLQTVILEHEREYEEQTIKQVSRKTNVCALCEEVTTQALNYLAENKTQIEIITLLHVACSKFHSLKHECVALVNYYAPLFFLEISTIEPSDFCQNVNLREQIVIISSQFHEDTCGLCHQAVSDILVKLDDPDTELEIIQLLQKACKSMKKLAKKCKAFVFQYGPLLLANTVKLLETVDICTTLHVCPPSKSNSNGSTSMFTGPLLSVS